jgi:gas vesicle protein
MSSGRAATADELTSSVRSMIDRVLEADVTETVGRRGKELASVLADATELAGDRAQHAWRDSAPARRDAAKTISRASRDAARWGRRTWKRDLGPQVREAWKRRELAIGAAGAAIPVGRELVDNAAAKLRLRRREEHHWRAFFLGLIVGAVGGALVALLTAPKAGRAMRDDLAEKARDAAENAGDWVPLFQRSGTPTNGGVTGTTSEVGGRVDDVTDATASEGEELR